MRRIAIVGVIALALLGMPLTIELATGREHLDALGLFIEILELFIFGAAIVAVALVTLEVRDMRRDRESLIHDLTESRAENTKWRESSRAHIDGVRNAIQTQFDAWGFTSAEKDIAGLILKGCSHREIAETRRSNASTVRQQAQSIYRKSGMENRSELAAYFLDAILDPTPGVNGATNEAETVSRA